VKAHHERVIVEGIGLDTTHVVFEVWAWLLVIGNLALYKLGKQGLEAVITRFPRIDPGRFDRAGELFDTRGSWILLLSSLPGLGLNRALAELVLAKKPHVRL
jgi:membrane protein DedA with SNARE-associated domain